MHHNAKQKFQQDRPAQQNHMTILLAFLNLLAPRVAPPTPHQKKKKKKVFLNSVALKNVAESCSLKMSQPHEKSLVLFMYNK